MPADSPQELLLGTVSWQRDAWLDAYYPDDLPEDWRLSYYANDCDCVLLRADDWRALEASELVELIDDTPTDFHCFFELDDATRPADLAFAADLDRKRSTLLVPRVDPKFRRVPQWVADQAGCWKDPDTGRTLHRWVIDQDSGPRDWRERAPSLDGKARALVLDGPAADPGRVGDLRTLLELMGRI